MAVYNQIEDEKNHYIICEPYTGGTLNENLKNGRKYTETEVGYFIR